MHLKCIIFCLSSLHSCPFLPLLHAGVSLEQSTSPPPSLFYLHLSVFSLILSIHELSFYLFFICLLMDFQKPGGIIALLDEAW